MKKNVIWVDFNKRSRSKDKPKKNFIENLIAKLKDLFTSFSKRKHKPKNPNNTHKSIL